MANGDQVFVKVANLIIGRFTKKGKIIFGGRLIFYLVGIFRAWGEFNMLLCLYFLWFSWQF